MLEQPGIIALIIFIMEIVTLYIFSRLITKSLARLFYHHTRNYQLAINIFAVILLPGTIIHELAHLLIAGVLLVPVGEIEFLPEIREDGVKLGTAEIGQTDIFRRSIIGVAPLIVGLTILISISWLNLISFQDTRFLILGKIALGYIIFVIANTMFSSRKDLEGAGVVVLFIIGIFILFYLLKLNQPSIWLLEIINNNSTFLQSMASFLVIPILVDGVIFAVIKLLSFRIQR